MKKKDTWFTMIQVAYDIFKRNKTQRVLQEVETHRRKKKNWGTNIGYLFPPELCQLYFKIKTNVL